MAAGRNGGCGCGAVRYSLAGEPFDTGWCHCRVRQLASGTPAMVFSTVPSADFIVEQGADKLGRFASTPFGSRQFCTSCGTPLTIQVDFQPETIDFAVATLDDPRSVTPGFHIFHAEAIGWSETADALPRHAGFRADTRGLSQ